MLIEQLQDRISELDKNPKETINHLLSMVDLKAPVETFEQAHNLLLLGRGYLITGNLDLSEQMLHKALYYINDQEHLMSKFQCYCNLGIVYREKNQFDLALKALNTCVNLSYDLEDFSYVILALVNISSVYTALGNHEKSIEMLENALGYKSQLNNTKILADLYNNYGFALMSDKQYAEALKYLMASYDVYKRLYGDDIQTNLVIALSNIGETYVNLGDYEHAKL